MRSIQPKVLKVQTLLRHLGEGRFAVPKLQREFVWTGPKAAKLFDSIYREMPIGTLVIWKTTSKFEALLRRSLKKVIPPFDSVNKQILFLIDGQQRLSVIYQAFAGSAIKNASGATVDFGRVTFDVQNELEDGESPFGYRLATDSEFITLKDILAPNWRHRLRRLPQYKIRRVEDCRRRILGYRVPILEVETKEIAEVRDLFVRINTQGMRISSADAAFARASRFDLRERAQEVRYQLPEEFSGVPYQTILQALAFVQGVRDVGQRSYAKLIDEWNDAIEDGTKTTEDVLPDWARLRKAFELAVEYLRSNFLVVDETVLPSNNMLATLSVYFFHHHGQPRAAARREIAKWFWATAVGQRYSGRGFRENLVADCDFFSRLAHGVGRFNVSELVDRHDVRRAEYNRRTSLTDAFFCMLALQKPLFVQTGAEMPPREYASRTNRENRHHIFPRIRLANAGLRPREYNSICNICLMAAQENLAFGSKVPRVYLAGIRQRKHFGRAMRSHLIPADSSSDLWDKDLLRGFRRFRDKRRDLICDAFEELAGVRLFQRQ